MYPSAGNIGGQKNFKRPAIRLMDFFDESFLVRVPRGRGGHPASEARQFHTRLTTVSSAYRKFLLALLDNATDLLFAARNHCNLSPAWAGQRRFFATRDL